MSRLSPQRRLVIGLSLALAVSPVSADTELLNVSYDVTRELYKDINPAFIAQWQANHHDTLTIHQSHGGSSKQAQSVIAGLEADVVTMNQVPDIDAIAAAGQLSPQWRSAFPDHAAPYTTTIVFLVRKGNPKGIHDWSDLTRPGLGVIVPNPKTSGNGRYTYLAAWGYALQKRGGEAQAKDFERALFRNVPVLDGGGRGATTTFAQRGIGDVLVTFENEASLVREEFGADQFDIVYPSLSIEAEAPVAVVDRNVDKHGTREVAQAYLKYLWTPAGQEIIARHGLRPRDKAVLRAHAASFPAIKTFAVEKTLGSWHDVLVRHFGDGGIYDEIVTRQ